MLETDRLILRWLATDDAEFILELLNEPSFLRFIGDKGVRTLEDARDYMWISGLPSPEVLDERIRLRVSRDML